MMTESELRIALYDIYYRLPKHNRRAFVVLRIIGERYWGQYDGYRAFIIAMEEFSR